MTQKQKLIINSHTNSTTYYLHHCYGKCSSTKVEAYLKCKTRCSELNGYDFKIISHNKNFFTIGFYYSKDNNTYFHYETHITSLDFLVK
jgi:hypothetical protein